jgi:hypothetical protein
MTVRTVSTSLVTQTGALLPGTAGLGVGSCHLEFRVGRGGQRDAELGPEHGSSEEADCDVFVLRLASSSCSAPVVRHQRGRSRH